MFLVNCAQQQISYNLTVKVFEILTFNTHWKRNIRSFTEEKDKLKRFRAIFTKKNILKSA